MRPDTLAVRATPALSVVMPSLDQRPYLGAAVESVLSQGGAEIELLVLDGGSRDGSIEALQALAARHGERLRWWSAPDGGPAQAVNRGVERARAAVVGWLNSDDLYAPGAVQRALAHLAAHPAQVMVYGQGEHVDAAGRRLAPYPSQPPSTPLAAFADGCHICQPTVFFRRDAYLALGGLDAGLRASFDFDLWLRFFKAHAGRIGYIDAVQARTRLHEATITARQRERVALEGLQVVHRHLGPAPGHWLLTHFDELCARHPFHAAPLELAAQCRRLVDTAAPWIAADTAAALRARIDIDRRIALAAPRLYADVQPDGWAGATLALRLWQPAPPWRAIELQGRHASPLGGVLRLRRALPGGGGERYEIAGPGPFTLRLPLDGREPGAQQVVPLECLDSFVPAECEPGSEDRRRLGFLVEAVRPVPA